MQREILYFFIISWFAFNICEGQRHLVCKEMEDAFTTEPSPNSNAPRRTGIPGKRGPQGEKGETGPQGPPAVVDYGRIETVVLEKLSSDIAALETKIDGLTSRTIEMNERLLVTEKQSNKLCDVSYNGKCFTVILPSAPNVNFLGAKNLCSNIGWKLANIYDPTHYEMIADYLRTKILASQTATTAWLGMTYNQETQTTLYSDGNTANVSEIKWFPNHPYRSPSYTLIGIHVDKDTAKNAQGIHTWSPNQLRRVSLCEV